VQHSIKRVVLDVLKLCDPPLPEFALQLCSTPNVSDVRVSLVEIDQNTESVKVTMDGDDLGLESVQKMMKDYRAVVHSIDEVLVGRKDAAD
jgi:hypothetical protein